MRNRRPNQRVRLGPPPPLPREILDRVGRVLAYHQATRHSDAPAVAAPGPPVDTSRLLYRIFADHPRTALPTNLRDAPLGTLATLETALDALPESFIAPPQDLRTLASWLHMAAGVTRKQQIGTRTRWSRSYPSLGEAFPCEIYLASFALKDLDSGLYHFSPREFALRKLRDGPQTLSVLTRGRPDLGFLKDAPAALLVSTVFCRSSVRFQKRGYRSALLDSGHLVQSLVTTATGLGIQTITRLRMTDTTTRELIGLDPDADYTQAEAVQAMVVWADHAHQPANSHSSVAGQAAVSDDDDAPLKVDVSSDSSIAAPVGSGATAGGVAMQAPARAPFMPDSPLSSLTTPDLLLPSIGLRTLPPIGRPALEVQVPAYGSILSVHDDCVARGVAVREIRAPLTESSPVHEEFPGEPMPAGPLDYTGQPLRRVLLEGRTAGDFQPRMIARPDFIRMNHIGFRSGSFYPMYPSGPHAALIRPFWLISAVTGMDGGVWYYHPVDDRWSMLRGEIDPFEIQYLCGQSQEMANASAVCFIVSTLAPLMTMGGPDIYRLAHIEAGLATERFHLAANAFGLGIRLCSDYFDDDVRKFLALGVTGWQPIACFAVGCPAEPWFEARE